VIRALKSRVCSLLCEFSHIFIQVLHKVREMTAQNANSGSFPQGVNGISLPLEKAHNVRAAPAARGFRRHVRDVEARPPR
jgi:hypothetical protein